MLLQLILTEILFFKKMPSTPKGWYHVLLLEFCCFLGAKLSKFKQLLLVKKLSRQPNLSRFVDLQNQRMPNSVEIQVT